MTTQEFLIAKGMLTEGKSVLVISGEFGVVTVNELLEEWESQQLSAERERAGKLVEAIELVISLGYVSDILTKPLNEYKQTINDYDTATKES